MGTDRLSDDAGREKGIADGQQLTRFKRLKTKNSGSGHETPPAT
jgi:hypothetical protein